MTDRNVVESDPQVDEVDLALGDHFQAQDDHLIARAALSMHEGGLTTPWVADALVDEAQEEVRAAQDELARTQATILQYRFNLSKLAGQIEQADLLAGAAGPFTRGARETLAAQLRASAEAKALITPPPRSSSSAWEHWVHDSVEASLAPDQSRLAAAKQQLADVAGVREKSRTWWATNGIDAEPSPETLSVLQPVGAGPVSFDVLYGARLQELVETTRAVAHRAQDVYLQKARESSLSPDEISKAFDAEARAAGIDGPAPIGGTAMFGPGADRDIEDVMRGDAPAIDLDQSEAAGRLAAAYAVGQHRFVDLMNSEQDGPNVVVTAEARDAAWAHEFVRQTWKPGQDTAPVRMEDAERFAEIAGAWSHVDVTVAEAVTLFDGAAQAASDPMLPAPLEAPLPTVGEAAAEARNAQLSPDAAVLTTATSRYATVHLQLLTARANVLAAGARTTDGRDIGRVLDTRERTGRRIEEAVAARTKPPAPASADTTRERAAATR